MAYRIGWYIKGQIIFSRLWGEQTEEDGQRVNQDLQRMLDQEGRDNVYVIVDGGQLEKSPSPSMSLLRSTFSAFRHPQLQWFINVGKVSRINNLMGIMLARLFGLNYRHFPSFEAALDFLRPRDKSLKWDQADESLLENSDADAGS